MAGKGGGAWKVAYADFVTAMMAFFMVMWLTSQKPEVKDAVASYFRDPYADQQGGAESDGPRRPRTPIPLTPPDDASQDATGKYAPSPNAAPPTISRSAYVTPWISIYFPLGEATLPEDAQRSLEVAAAGLAGKPNRVELRAHSVRKPLPEGSAYRDHWELCYARSKAIMTELEKRGVQPIRFRLSQSEGNEPASTLVEADAVRENSRVDILVLSEIAERPSGLGPSGDRRRSLGGASEQPAGSR